MLKLSLLLLVAGACGAKSAPPTEPTPPPPSTPDPGSAPPPTAEPTGAICGTRGASECPADMFCNFEPGANCGDTDRPGHCAKKTEMCAQVYKPVCGCDGKTYGNACEAAGAAVGVRAEGECK